MRNKLTKFLTSECPPKGMRQFAKTWKYAACMFLAFFLGIGNMWGADLEIPLTNLKAFPLDYGLVSVANTENTTIGSNQLQANKTTAKFAVATKMSGFYLKTISFVDANTSKNGGFTCDEGEYMEKTVTGDVTTYTYTAPDATTTAANFQLKGTGGTAKMGTIVITLTTSKQVERLTGFGSISSQKIPFTSSAATSNIELSVPSSSAVSTSSSRISIGSGGKHLVVTAKNNKVLKAIAVPKYQQSTYGISCTSNPEGTFSENIWSTTASNVTSVDLTLTVSSTVYSQELYVVYENAASYTITYDANGGSGTMSNSTNTVSACTFTAPDATLEFKEWNTKADGTGDPYKAGDSAPSNLDLFAIWQTHTASNNANLSALEVAGCTLNETFDAATTAYTIDLPFYGTMPAVGDVTATKDDANAATPEVSISGNVITVHCVAEDGTSEKDYTITVSIAAAPTASSSINIEQLVLDNSKKYDIGAALDAAHIDYVDKDALDSLKDQSGRNEPYLGLKFKKTTSKVTIIVPASTELNVKFGYIDGSAGLQVSVNGSAAATPSLTSNVYTLAASAGVKEVVFTQTGAKTVVYKQIMVGEAVQSVTLPWLVTYDAGEHGTCATAKETWKGTALTLPTVTPESGWNFEGWKDDEDNSVASPYTPTKNVTLTAQYSAIASGTDLDALTYKIGTGAATAVGYTTGTHEYTVKLPYAGSYDAITVAATPVSGASIVDDVTKVLTVTSLPGDATFTITDGVNTQLYTVHFVMSPKDGVSIIKAIADDTNQDIKAENLSGLYKKAGHIYTSGSYKLDQKRYFMVQLEDGKNFQEGDVVEINVSSVNDCNGFTIYSDITGDDFADGNLIIDTHDETGTAAKISEGINKITLPSYAGSNKLYVARKNGTQKYLNAGINQVEVKRAMNPVLTAIQFNSTDVEVTSTTVAVLLPQGTNLGTMTVTPTIYWNGAGSAAPTAAWAWGANTYRVTDKDGDYTDYTITLTEDELKHNVSFNTHGGSTIDPVQVVDGGYLAPAQVPEDPTKDENVFKFWSETEDGAEVDITTVQINADKTFHAVWEAEPAGIKLFSNTGELNTAKFITPAKADDPIVIDAVPYPTLVAFGSNRTSLGGAKQADVVLYSATTNQTKIKFQLYNTNSSAKKAYLWMVEEGATESGDPIEIEVDGETMVTTGYYTFNSNKNRSFYLTSGSKADIKVLQAKVIESGTDIHQFGQAGYELNFNKGRIAVAASATVQFEGASIHSNEDYSVLNSSNFKPKTYIQFNNAVANTIVKITKSSSNKYYVTNDLDNKGEGYSTDTEVELTTTGTWYIGSLNSGSVAALSKIEFIAPKCAEPAFNSLANSDLCEGAAFEALNGTATVGDAGTPIYQWYKADGDVEIEGATSATYTPTADGSYYVVATNQLAGYSDNSKKSNTVSVTHFAAAEITTAPLNQRGLKDAEVTLSVAATGKNLSYEWFTCDNEAGENPVAVVPAATGTSLNVTITEGMSQWYKVVVTSDCGNASATAKVEQFVPATPANVTESIVWDWTSAAWPASGEVQFTDKTEDGTDLTPAYELLADADAIVPNNAAFRSDMLYGKGQYVWRSGNKFFQGTAIKFTTEVAGRVRVYYRSTGNNKHIQVKINGTLVGTYETGDFRWSDYVDVPVGDVEIICTSTDANKSYTRIQKIEFQTPSYVRTEMLGNGVYGTICVDHNVPAGGVRGVTVYEIAGREPQYGKIAFDEVTEMEAGVPYVFIAHGNEMALYYGETKVDNPVDKHNGMYGTFTAQTLTDLDGIYYFAKSALWSCVDLTSLNLPANRAYVKLSEIDYLSDPNPAPGRKRILLGVNGQNATTDLGNVQGDEVQSTKVLINGQLFILRGEKLYDATGRMVK